MESDGLIHVMEKEAWCTLEGVVGGDPAWAHLQCQQTS